MTSRELADKLGKMHAEYGSIGPLLFGIRYHREIAECLDTPEKIATAALGKPGYRIDIGKGMKLARYVRPL